jgi:hypothetical protein
MKDRLGNIFSAKDNKEIFLQTTPNMKISYDDFQFFPEIYNDNNNFPSMNYKDSFIEEDYPNKEIVKHYSVILEGK